MNKDLEYFKEKFAEYIDFLYSLREKTKTAEVYVKDIEEPSIGIFSYPTLLDVRIASKGNDREEFHNLSNEYIDRIEASFPSLNLMLFKLFLLNLQRHIHISKDNILIGISSPDQFTQILYRSKWYKPGFCYKDHYLVTTDSKYDECLEKLESEYKLIINGKRLKNEPKRKLKTNNVVKNQLEENTEKNNDILEKIKEAKKMLDAGIIDENEFKEIKSKLIKDM